MKTPLPKQGREGFLYFNIHHCTHHNRTAQQSLCDMEDKHFYKQVHYLL